MIIDAHHHLWQYRVEEYGWISPAMAALARDFTVDNLRRDAEPRGVVGSIAVQARQSVEETDALLGIAEASDYVHGVVGWAPLAEAGVGELLDGWSSREKLAGFRHVVQDEPDDDFLDRPDFNRGVTEVMRRGLTYDILIFSRQLPAAIRFVDRHPEGRFVLDHIAKPPILAGEIGAWRESIKELARRPNVSCKVSGVVTEANLTSWTTGQILPYLNTVLEAFGPTRLMFGSDWPVCLLATTYARWLDVLEEWVAPWSPCERRAFFADTAATSYQLTKGSA